MSDAAKRAAVARHYRFRCQDHFWTGMTNELLKVRAPGVLVVSRRRPKVASCECAVAGVVPGLPADLSALR